MMRIALIALLMLAATAVAGEDGGRTDTAQQEGEAPLIVGRALSKLFGRSRGGDEDGYGALTLVHRSSQDRCLPMTVRDALQLSVDIGAIPITSRLVPPDKCLPALGNKDEDTKASSLARKFSIKTYRTVDVVMLSSIGPYPIVGARVPNASSLCERFPLAAEVVRTIDESIERFAVVGIHPEQSAEISPDELRGCFELFALVPRTRIDPAQVRLTRPHRIPQSGARALASEVQFNWVSGVSDSLLIQGAIRVFGARGQILRLVARAESLDGEMGGDREFQSPPVLVSQEDFQEIVTLVYPGSAVERWPLRLRLIATLDSFIAWESGTYEIDAPTRRQLK